MGWLRAGGVATLHSCEREWERLNGDVDEMDGGKDADAPDTDALQVPLQRDASWNQDTSVVDPSMVSALEKLNAKLTLANVTVPTTVHGVLKLMHDAWVSRIDFQGSTVSAKERASKVDETIRS